MRQGRPNCPACRQDLVQHMDGMTVRARAQFLRTKARNKSAPLALKRCVEELRQAEEEHKQARANDREFRKRNRALLREESKLIRRNHATRHRVRIKTRQLGVPQSPDFPLPGLIVDSMSMNLW